MKKTKEILRQKWLLGRSHRAIAESVGVSAGTVGDTVGRARLAALSDWAARLEERFARKRAEALTGVRPEVLAKLGLDAEPGPAI